MKEHIQAIINQEKQYPQEERMLYHYNCAETLLMAADRKYSLNVPEEYVRLVLPYGGGMNTGHTCGALLGALAAFGRLYGEDKPTLNTKMKAAVKAYVHLFEEMFHSLDCAEIRPAFKDEKGSCAPVMVKAGELFDYVSEHIDEICEEERKKQAEKK
ncbi:MAG: C_GCAxxG_C_C family protein [Solobacterium sp.]|nr:C_GCAxxG_C_C family protein [Solobacterium sp.]